MAEREGLRSLRVRASSLRRFASVWALHPVLNGLERSAFLGLITCKILILVYLHGPGGNLPHLVQEKCDAARIWDSRTYMGSSQNPC